MFDKFVLKNYLKMYYFRICLLADGKLAFLGTTPEAITFFEEQGFPLPENFNPADHFISTLAIEPGQLRRAKNRINVNLSALNFEIKRKFQKICDSFLKSDLGREVLENAQDSGRSSIESADSVSRSNSIAAVLAATDVISTTGSDSSEPSSSDELPLYNKKGNGQFEQSKYGKRTLQRYKST